MNPICPKRHPMNLIHITEITETAKGAADHIAGITALVSLALLTQWLSLLAAAMSVAWYAYRFYTAWRDKKKVDVAKVLSE